jgi:hypothetical protein
MRFLNANVRALLPARRELGRSAGCILATASDILSMSAGVVGIIRKRAALSSAKGAPRRSDIGREVCWSRGAVGTAWRFPWRGPLTAGESRSLHAGLPVICLPVTRKRDSFQYAGRRGRPFSARFRRERSPRARRNALFISLTGYRSHLSTR